jgi:hypothetical protein
LLRAHIDSVEKLDLLITLARVPDRIASLRVLSRLAELPLGTTRRLAGELESSGLVVLDGNRGARLLPSRKSDEDAVAELLAEVDLNREEILAALMGRDD